MNKKIIFLAFSVIATIFLSSCGSTVDQGKKQVEFFSSKSENQVILKQFVDEYEASHPDVKIILSTPADAGTVLRTRLVKDDIPTIIAYGGDVTYTELANVGMLEDLSDESFVQDILPAYKKMTQDLQQDRTKLYGVPYVANASGVIYNEELFKRYNLEIPQTWDEFIQVCQIFKENNITPIEGTFKDAWTLQALFNPIAGTLSPDEMMRDRKENKTKFQTEWPVVLEKMAEAMTYTQKDAMGTSYADGTQAFAKGEAAMLINGTWAIPEVVKANPELKVNIFPLPASNEASKNVVTSGVDVMFMIGKGTKNQKEAKEFIHFLLEKQQLARYCDDQFAFSAIRGVSQTEPSLSGISPYIEDGKVTDFIDHLLPNGYDLASMLSEFALDQTKNPKDLKVNTDRILNKMDDTYDVANIK